MDTLEQDKSGFPERVELVDALGRPVELEANNLPMKLLRFLRRDENLGKVISYEEIYRNVWNGVPAGDFERRVQAAARELKKLFGEESEISRQLELIRGTGLRYGQPQPKPEVYFCPKSATVRGSGPYSSVYVEPPKKLMEDLFASVEKHKITFLSAMSGQGKTELAQCYAARSKFRYVVFLELDPMGKRVQGMRTIESFRELVKRSAVEVAGMAEADLETKLKLLRTATADTLVVVDNLNFLAKDGEFGDGDTDELIYGLERLTGQAKVLITSQLAESYLKKFKKHGVIPLEQYYDVSYGIALLSEYSEQDLEASKAARELVERVPHVLLLTLLGERIRQLGSGSERYLLARVKESVITTMDAETRNVFKNGKAFQETAPSEVLRQFFGPVLSYQFTQRERQVIGALILLSPYLRNAEQLCELVGDLPGRRVRGKEGQTAKQALERLIRLNIIRGQGEEMSIHPLFQEYFSEGQEEGKALAELTPNFAFHLVNNAAVGIMNHGTDTWWRYAHKAVLLQMMFRKGQDWTWQLWERNMGWFYQRFWFKTEEGSGDYVFRALRWNELCAAGATAEQARAEVAKELEWTTEDLGRYNRLDCVSAVFSATGPNGICFYLYDFAEQKTWTLIDLSRQMEPAFRYFGSACAEYQGGEMDTIQEGELSVFESRTVREIELRFPEQVAGLPLTHISRMFAQYEADIELLGRRKNVRWKIWLPETVKTIDESAFADTGDCIVGIRLPSSLVAIGDCACRGCSALRRIEIPPSVERIGWQAFAGCGLTEVVLRRGVVLRVRVGFFLGDAVLGEDAFPDEEGRLCLRDSFWEAHPEALEECRKQQDSDLTEDESNYDLACRERRGDFPFLDRLFGETHREARDPEVYQTFMEYHRSAEYLEELKMTMPKFPFGIGCRVVMA